MTQDLTQITTPFGLLDAETRSAIKAAFNDGKELQHYASCGYWADVTWVPYWSNGSTYRVKPETVTVSKWSNIYHSGIGGAYSSREDADIASSSLSALAVLRIDYTGDKVTAHIEEL